MPNMIKFYLCGMNILVRLPNWLGDVTMSTAFLHALKSEFPEARLDVIIKKQLSGLLSFVDGIERIHEFDKKEYPGINGPRKFVKKINATCQYDLFFCLPDSFSSARMGALTNAKKRIGYKAELRGIFLSHSYRKGKGQHRANEYVGLLSNFTGKAHDIKVSYSKKGSKPGQAPNKKYLILNVNSEASSRRFPIQFAQSILKFLISDFNYEIVLTGGPADIAYVNEVAQPYADKVHNLAGKTNLTELGGLLQNAELLISPDTGISHLCNAFGTKTIVLHGADDENNTRPFNDEGYLGLRKPGLECAPCVKNTCKFGIPKCLNEMELSKIKEAVKLQLNAQK
jgi:lipopolysaccharide heptosyltransferase II